MSLRIPDSFIRGFEILLKLSMDEVKEIGSIISQIPYGLGQDGFSAFFKSKYNKTEDFQLSSTIYSFGNLLFYSKKSKEEIAKNLSDSFFVNNDLEKDNDLEAKIFIILNNSQNLKQTFKAADLISDNDVIFSDGKVFSDIRLLFEDNVELYSERRKAVIIHRLKLESSKNGSNENFYFSLDSNDLVKLKEIISRAILKDSQIKNDYLNIEFIDITD
ncbi:hypothetical protein H0I25_00030 [Cellulophaga sp. HaHa_2_95]|uniref:hypothetical protein n=1 Tax=Cellulophaga sp. HaHa_2_95 TaxID=2745558 RepID=UPI001C4F1A13|nr:hypothetical protein [Cellulophaga sp. HaHa_2_95]QXP56216.1 hypothetical protein H0I25_00030 [Cellulophaga sp. HaHa_2_95]